MIRGTINDRREAVVRLRVRGPSGAEATLDAVLDTGFTAALCLPALVIKNLRLPVYMKGTGTLADGSVTMRAVHKASIQWGEDWLSVNAWEMGKSALIGMRLLYGHDIHIRAVLDGEVRIEPLP